MSKITTFDFSDYIQEEKNLINWLEEPTQSHDLEMKAPKDETINRILSFSKALEIKNSNTIGTIENLMN